MFHLLQNRVFKLLSIIFLTCCILPLTSASAQDVSLSDWQATYWNNTDLSGVPAFERTESNIDYDWGYQSPIPDHVDADRFSARWTRSINVEAGTYRFTVTSDDGVRVWLDGQLIVDEWYVHSPLTVNVDRQLSDGQHQIRVEYYENTGGAVIQLSWRPVSSPSSNWRAEYYNNTTLSGSPRIIRSDPVINFNWGTDSPDPLAIGEDYFSVRWQRTLNLPAGLYRFSMTVDDGGRLWIDGDLQIDAWRVQSPRTYEQDVYLSGGPVDVQLEYFENTVGAQVRLEWERISTSPDPVAWRGEYYNNTALSGQPAVVRQDDSLDFNWETGSPAPGYIAPDNFSVRWTRSINFAPAGTYRFIAESDDGVRVWVNNSLVIDNWDVQTAEGAIGSIDLPRGPATVTVEYFERFGEASVQLNWGFVPPEPGR